MRKFRFGFKMIKFHTHYGSKATMEAYGISKATIFRWKKRYKDSNYEAEALMDESGVPKVVRRREVPKEIEDFIIRYRQEHLRSW